MAAWPGLMGRLAQRLKARGAHPARTLVLLPFAQLMPVATRQWAACHPGWLCATLRDHPQLGPAAGTVQPGSG
jgi:hypothetical protein